MSTSKFIESEIKKTKGKYLVIVTGTYFQSGFFWVFSTVGALKLLETSPVAVAPTEPVKTLFSSMIVLMLSNAIWEILTGWYADKFRRRFSISAAFFVCLIGYILMGLASFIHLSGEPITPVSFYSEPRVLVWLIGVTVWSLGPALYSGAEEAWLVDRCNFLSANPPEELGPVFKKANRFGVLAKATGLLICYAIMSLFSDVDLQLAFSLAAGAATLASLLLFVYSLGLKEEYWSDPKYQSEESLFAFLWMGIKDLWKVPYRWFTLAFMGATSLNYVLSWTVWPYLEEGKLNGFAYIAGGIVGIELLGGYISRAFSRSIDRIRAPELRMPVASLMYLAPVLPLYFAYFVQSPTYLMLVVLIAATFFFRTAHASVFGTLYAVGQLAIESDERRAVLISMSSALAALLTAGVLLIVHNTNPPTVGGGIQTFWVYMSLPGVLILAVGGYLVAKRRESQSAG